jgi:hypothetical protein
MQLGFSDSDGNYDMNITKADDNSDITKKIKQWYSLHGDVKLLSIDDIRRKVRGTMVSIQRFFVVSSSMLGQVSFNGFLSEIITPVPQADDFWMNVADDTREIIVKIVCSAAFDKATFIEAVGKTIMFKHVYVVNKDAVFYDEMASIPSSFKISPPDSEHLLQHFKQSE